MNGLHSEEVKAGSIAIVGGGISGIILAIALTQRNIPCEIFEQSPAFTEIGAGLGFNPAAIRAMKLCSVDIYESFLKIATGNADDKDVLMQFVDGFGDEKVGCEKPLFTLGNPSGGESMVHRAQFLDEMARFVPEGITHFNKRLESIDEGADGMVTLNFNDGTSHKTSAVIGCDGIKSKVRAWMMGPDHPSSLATYTHKYAYRGLIPMDQALPHLGSDLALNAKVHMGKDGHLITFPISQGTLLNFVAFMTDEGEWPSETRLVLPTTREEVQKDFGKFGPTVQRISQLLPDTLNRWGIFDTGNAMPYYNKGSVLVVGDAAHATSPHHGSGAGMCIEDAAVLAELLIDPRVAKQGTKGLQAAFQAFSNQRLERSQYVVTSSRRVGELYDWRTELGEDCVAIKKELDWRFQKIWDGQITEFIAEAKVILGEVLNK